MEATMFLGFVLTVVIGFSFLAFLLELLDTERPPLRQKKASRVTEGVSATGASPTLIPAFFVKPVAAQVPPPTLGFDDALWTLLQHHVKAEQAAVAEFVHLPSIDSLYRQVRTPLTMN